jgi:hypothetical protein
MLLIVLAAGLAGRSRAATLLARAGLGAALAAIAWTVARYVGFSSLDSPDELTRRFYLLGIALGATGIVALFLLVRRIPPVPRFGLVDALPLAGVAAALFLGMLWFVGDDARLRGCRTRNAAACDVLATRLLEAAERTPAAPPTRWEQEAARVLNAHACGSPEPSPCAIQLYALGTVALRAGRFEAARDAFLRACEEDRSWCARAARERSLPWTPQERARLEARP